MIELPQVSFLVATKQMFCRDKLNLSRQAYFCCERKKKKKKMWQLPPVTGNKVC